MKNIEIKARESIYKFCEETGVISMEGRGASMLLSALSNKLLENEQNYKNIYIEKIQNISNNNSYDENGVLIETQLILDAIEEKNDIISNINFQSSAKEIIKNFCAETKIMNVSGKYSKIFYLKLLKNMKKKHKNQQLKKLKVYL